MKKIYFYKNKLNSNIVFSNESLEKNYKEKLFSEEYQGLKEEIKNLNLSDKYQNILNQKLFKLLNKHHRVNYPNRYWKILLNRWVKFYVDTIIFRYFFILENIKKNKVKSFYFKFKEESIIPNSSWEFYQILINEERDNYLSYKIATYIKKNYPNIKIFNKKDNLSFQFKKNLVKPKLFLYNLFNGILKLFLEKKNPIIISSYLPPIKEFILKIKIGKIFFWKSYFDVQNNELLSLLEKKRPKRRSKLINTRQKKNLEKIILELVDEFLPSYYLENFDFVQNFVKSRMIVRKPRYILTSNEFLFNEFFKFYTVECLKSKNTKYYVGQHGSKYGCIKEQQNTIEEETSDKFITWGWKNNSKHLPIGVLKTLGQKKYNLPKKIEKIYIINQNLPDTVTVFNTNKEFLKKFDNTLKFLKNINKKYYDKIIFRIHNDDLKYFRFYENHLNKISKKITIDKGQKNLLSLVNSNSLLIFTYYSSGFLEFLSLNKVGYLFFKLNKKIYLNKFYKLFFKLKNQIIFEDPKYFADFINRLCEEKNIQDNVHYDKNLINFKKQFANYIGSIDLINKRLK